VADSAGSSESSQEPDARERRRFPRVAANGIRVGVPLLVDAEVIDIGVSGALVRCRCPLRVGDRAQLRIVLGRQPFLGTMSVVRVVRAWNPDRGSTDVGVAFVECEDESTRVLREFLSEYITRSVD